MVLFFLDLIKVAINRLSNLIYDFIQKGNGMEANQVGTMLPSFNSFVVIMKGRYKYHIPTKKQKQKHIEVRKDKYCNQGHPASKLI